MKKTRNFSFFLCLILIIGALVVLLKVNKDITMLIPLAVLFFSFIGLCHVSEQNGEGEPIDLKNIKEGIRFQLTYIRESKEEQKNGKLKSVHIHHLYDGRHTYIYMYDQVLLNGSYEKNQEGKLVPYLDY
jgi:hypothetical protein